MLNKSTKNEKDNKKVAEAYHEYGVTLHNMGKYEEAIVLHTRVLAMYESLKDEYNKGYHAKYLTWKAFALGALDKLPEAIEILHTACTLDHSAKNVQFLAQAYALKAIQGSKNNEEVQAANKHYDKALGISEEASIHTYYAGFLYTQKEFPKAIEEWECALRSPTANEEIFPQILAIGSVIPCIQEEIRSLLIFSSIVKLLAHCSLVIVYQQQNNLPKAQSHLTQLIRSINTHAEPAHTHCSLLGYAHRAMGNTQEAYAAFKKAYELYPTQPHAPEYTLAKKNMLEQEQLLARNASGEPAAISNPSSTPTITQTALITTDLTSEQALQ